MKHLSILFIALTLCLAACNKNNEPPVEVQLPIREAFLPENVLFDYSDKDFLNRLKDWNNKKVVVNSVDEIPNDPIGFNESYYKIDFTDQTMLLYYMVHDYDVVSYNNIYFRNTVENTYNWTISLGVNGEINEDDNVEKLIFSRYAILVKKLPDNADIIIWKNISDHSWSWDK